MKQSLVRHLLTSLGSIALVTGFSKAVPILQWALENLDPLWAAGTVIGGGVTTLVGFLLGRKK